MNRRSTTATLLPVGALAAGGIIAWMVPNIAGGAIPAGSESTRSAVYSTALSGANEVPAANNNGSGSATVILDRAANRVCWRIEVAGITLPAAAAHIHQQTAGNNGPVVVTFTAPDANGVSEGCVNPTATTANDIAANPTGFYVNVHNTDFPGGAVRGQLSAPNPVAGSIHLLDEPLRAYDSRDTGGRFAAETRTISLRSGKNGAGASRLAVPPGASAAIVNLTVTETDSTGGWARIYSASLTGDPATSTVNWFGGNQNIANETTVAVDPMGRVKVTTFRPTHVIIDVVGYLL